MRPNLIEDVRLLFTVYLEEIYGDDTRTAQCFATEARWEDTTTTTTWGRGHVWVLALALKEKLPRITVQCVRSEVRLR